MSSQLWRLWKFQSVATTAAIITAVTSMVNIPKAIIKERGLDKFTDIISGLVLAEGSRRLAFASLDLSDTDADITYAERRVLIAQHTEAMKQMPAPSLPVLEPAHDESFTEYWQRQDKHLMIVGGTGAGKSTFISDLVGELDGWELKVYDIDATKDDWKTATKVCHEYDDIADEMLSDLAEIGEVREERRVTGSRTWKPSRHRLTVADEFPALISHYKKVIYKKTEKANVASEWSVAHAKQTRKLKRFIAVMCQNDTVKNTGLEGDNDVRDSCFVVVYLTTKAQRRAEALGHPEWAALIKKEPYAWCIADEYLFKRPGGTK